MKKSYHLLHRIARQNNVTIQSQYAGPSSPRLATQYASNLGEDSFKLSEFEGNHTTRSNNLEKLKDRKSINTHTFGENNSGQVQRSTGNFKKPSEENKVGKCTLKSSINEDDSD